MTTTDEILALAGAAAGPGVAAPASAEAVDQAAEVTEAELAAFVAAAARGATSDVVRALLAISPGPSPAPTATVLPTTGLPTTGLPTTGLPTPGPSRNPAWTAWL